MGSKLRKLRKAAGVTGAAYQAQQRREAHAAALARTLMTCVGCGHAKPVPGQQLCRVCALETAARSVMLRGGR